jgi:hypothetical protein
MNQPPAVTLLVGAAASVGATDIKANARAHLMMTIKHRLQRARVKLKSHYTET